MLAVTFLFHKCQVVIREKNAVFAFFIFDSLVIPGYSWLFLDLSLIIPRPFLVIHQDFVMVMSAMNFGFRCPVVWPFEIPGGFGVRKQLECFSMSQIFIETCMCNEVHVRNLFCWESLDLFETFEWKLLNGNFRFKTHLNVLRRIDCLATEALSQYRPLFEDAEQFGWGGDESIRGDSRFAKFKIFQIYCVQILADKERSRERDCVSLGRFRAAEAVREMFEKAV